MKGAQHSAKNTAKNISVMVTVVPLPYSLASEYGKGTTVTITLPTDLAPNSEEGPV